MVGGTYGERRQFVEGKRTVRGTVGVKGVSGGWRGEKGGR